MKMSTCALAALMILPGAAVMAATTAPATAAAPAKTKPAPGMKIRGIVVSVDAVAGTLTVKNKKGDETISVPATAAIHVGKAEAKLADITTDSHVEVTFKNENGKPVASSVRVMPMKAMPAKAAPADAAKK